MQQAQSGVNTARGLFKLDRASFFVYVLLIPALIAYHALSRAKLIYFLPLIMLLVPLIQAISIKRRDESLRFEPNMLVSLGLYLFLVLIGLGLNYSQIEYGNFIRDVLIILSPLIVFAFQMQFSEKHIKWLFVATVISYFAWVGFAMEFDFSFSFIQSNYNLASEFHNGVIIGCFFVFFLSRKRFLWAAMALLLIFMSGKRSIFLGVVPALAVWYLFFLPFKVYKNTHLTALILLLYFGAFYAVGVNFDVFSKWFLDFSGLDARVSLDRFLMGREIFIIYLKNQIADSEWLQYVFGYGPGQADIFLYEEARPDWMSEARKSVNPHNDFLKLRFDYGLVGSLLLFIVFYSSYVRSKMGIQMFLYTIPLFLVDNSFIFIYYWFIAMTVARFDSDQHALPGEEVRE